MFYHKTRFMRILRNFHEILSLRKNLLILQVGILEVRLQVGLLKLTNLPHYHTFHSLLRSR
jgi:hypothetical protein